MGFGNGAFQAARIAIDGVTIVENIYNGKIQAQAASTKFSNINNTVNNGESWLWGSYLLLSSKTSNVSAGLEWTTAAQVACTSDAIILNSDSVSFEGFVSTNNTSSNTISVTISTTSANDLIVVGATSFNSSAAITSTSISDTAGLTWTERESGVEWTAIASSALTSDVITLTYTTAGAVVNNSNAMMAFGVTNVNTTTTFDTGANIPNQSRSNQEYVISLQSAPITTTGSNRVVLAIWGGNNSSTGFTVENVVTSVSSSDSSLTISPTTGAVVANLNAGHANTWSSKQTFTGGSGQPIQLGSGSNPLVLMQANSSYTAGYHYFGTDGNNIYLILNEGTGSTFTVGRGIPNYSLTVDTTNGSVTTLNNTLDDGSGNLTVAGTQTINIGSSNTIYAEIQIAGTAEWIFDRDLTSTNLDLIAQTSGSLFKVSSGGGGNVNLSVSTTGAVSTINNTLDDGSGNMIQSAGAYHELQGATSGNIQQKAAGTTTSYAVTWPAAVSAGAGYALTSDTSGNLSWTSVSGAVSSVSNSDGSLTISPTTGAVVASLDLANSNTWTSLQYFNPTTAGNALAVGPIPGATLLVNTSAHSTASYHNTLDDGLGNMTVTGTTGINITGSGAAYQIGGTSIFALTNTWTKPQYFSGGTAGGPSSLAGGSSTSTAQTLTIAANAVGNGTVSGLNTLNLQSDGSDLSATAGGISIQADDTGSGVIYFYGNPGNGTATFTLGGGANSTAHGSVLTTYNTLDNGSGNAIFGTTSLSNNVVTINGASTVVYLALALSAGTYWQIQDDGTNGGLQLSSAQGSGKLSTNHNTLDDGSGSVTFAGHLNLTTGTNHTVGQATLASGTVTVDNTSVTSSSLIFLSYANGGGTQGSLRVGSITAGTSFVIDSSSSSDTSTVNWLIIN